MICIYEPNTTDFTGNGLGALAPKSCKVTETLNGEWELEMEHPLDDFGKWQRIVEGRIVRAPVSAAETPRIALLASVSGKEIYRVTTSGLRLNLRSGTGTKYKVLGAYKSGTEVVVLDKTTSSWYEVACPDGKRGYMYAANLTYLRTETTVVGRDKVIMPKQLRDQPFRIYRVVPSLTGVKVYARHIFYDLANNMLQKYEASSSDAGALVAQGIALNCQSEHDFTFYSDLTTTAEDVTFENVNPIEALLGEDGLIEKYGAELARDWFDVYLVSRVGKDTDVQIREGKNMLGVTYDVDETEVVTRIMPTGETKDGKVLYLDELYIDSPRIGSYPHPKWYHLAVSEAKVGDDMTTAQAKEKMRAAAQAEFGKGCDLPAITMTVSFVNCADTVEFAQYKALQNIFLGDTVSVIARRIGVAVAMRVTQYTFDCLTSKYDKIVLGVATEALEGSSVLGKQLPNGEIRGTKLALGSVGAGQLQDGSVGSLKIQLAAIGTAHIGDAAITNAKIGTAAIDTANIKDLAVVSAKIAALAVGTAQIANLAVTAAKIAEAAIETAKIADAAITHAKIGTAAIETANIKDAAIETAKIALGAITTALIEAGAVGTAQIADASITDAKIVSLSANRIDAGVLSVERLIISGSDKSLVFAINNMGELVSATVDTIDAYALTDRTITADKIVAGAITADELGAACVIANKIASGAIETDKLAANAVTAIKIAAGAIETGHISAGTWDALMLDAQARITLAVTGVQVGGTNHATGTDAEASISAWTGAVNQNTVTAWKVRVDPAWQPGDVLTLSCYYEMTGVAWSGGACGIYLHGPGDVTAWAPQINVSVSPQNAHILYGNTATSGSGADASGRVEYQITLTDAWLTNNYFTVYIRGDFVTAGTVRAWRFQAERGSIATDWSPHPEEFRAGSSIDIREGSIRMSAPLVEISVPKSESDETVVARFNEDGLYADSVLSPSVLPVYRGPSALHIDPAASEAQVDAGTHFRSISAALAALNFRCHVGDVTVYLAQGITCYENVTVRCALGFGLLKFVTQGSPAASDYATVGGYVLVNGCSVQVEFSDLKIVSPYASGSGNLVGAYRATFVRLTRCILSGNAHTTLMCHASEGASVHFDACEFYNTDATSAMRCLYAYQASQIVCANCKGNMGAAVSLMANTGRVVAYGTIPYTSGTPTLEQNNGEVRAAGVTMDAGSAPPAYVPPTAYAYPVTDTRTRSSEDGWFGTGDRSVRQGYAKGLGKLHGCMWFDNTTIRAQLAGKTVLSATLRVKCLNNGLDGAKLLFLIGVTNTSASGSVAGLQTYGSIGSIAWGDELELPIPAAAADDLISGAINALVLYSDEDADDLVSGKDYSKRYRRLAGYGAAGAPSLAVVVT